jgi:geranylgeranyl pyrophosphate synthase
VSRSAVPPPVTRVLDAAQTWLPRRLGTVESRLGELATGHGELLAAEAGATLAAGGKRLRPMLVLLCAGPDAGPGALRAATAIELVHMATLVHDDVLDAAPLRRGVPTVVARAGPEVATAVGDLLFSRAFAELGGGDEGGDDPPGAQGGAARQVRLLADASVALAQGELAQRRDAFRTELEEGAYLERCRLKTARLFECACVIGLGPADRAAEDALREFGAEIGLAFQLLDDVLDVAGPPERTGKARGTDLLDGTITMPFIRARERDPELASIDLRALDESGAEQVCERIAATGALEAVRAAATERVGAAKRALDRGSLERDRLELLAMVADGVVERYS